MRRNTAGAAGETGLLALRTLARREVSTAALREALRRAGLTEQEVEAELQAAIRLGALDDRRSARARARALVLRGGWGREAMHARLVQQGYPPALAEDALAEAIRDEGWTARAAAASVLSPNAPPRRSARRLLARGFDPALVRELVPGVEGIDEGG
ncbi:MAG TPA: RecX family transcriptional regulator [Myxococcaceae bacterium]|nr:RecX family transcriptional regulator [Myxococcaceae bacterium]